MQAYILINNQAMPPFGQPAGEIAVHNIHLRDLQRHFLRALGCRVDLIHDLAQIRRLPALVVFDDLYFTCQAMAKFLRALRRRRCETVEYDARGQNRPVSVGNCQAALAVSDLTERFAPTFQGKSVQAADGKQYRAYNCFFLTQFDPERPLDTQVSLAPLKHRVSFVRTRVSRQFEPSGKFVLPVSPVFMTPIQHWSSLIGANMLGLPGFLLSILRTQVADAALLPAKLVWRSGSLRPQKLLGKSYLAGRKCQVHPTAHVEGSILGDKVRIEPHAVVRGCVIGKNSCVGPTAVVEGCTLGQEVTVNAGVLVRSSMVGDGANIGSFFTQFSVIGRRAVLCPDSGILDYQFHSSVQVSFHGRMVPSGSTLLGACLGDRVFLGPGVRIQAGQEVPNDSILVPNPRSLVRDINRGLPAHVISLDSQRGRPVVPRHREKDVLQASPVWAKAS
jgi:carbonic anhydrase/acetyltransferase-like protein (isoleucine patch superfamily)